MYTITDAHPITIFGLSSLMMFVSFFIVSMYASAGFVKKGYHYFIHNNCVGWVHVLVLFK